MRAPGRLTKALARRWRAAYRRANRTDLELARQMSFEERYEATCRLMAWAQTIPLSAATRRKRERDEAVVRERWRRLREHYLARKRSP